MSTGCPKCGGKLKFRDDDYAGEVWFCPEDYFMAWEVNHG
jgi:phage/plasmid primase-like uncharacterized protein